VGPGSHALTFRPLREDDLPRLHAWLNEPHVVATYGLGRTPSLAEVIEKYGPRARGAAGTRAFVIEADGAAVGYVQTYRIADHAAYAAEIDVAGEEHGLDLFLGDACMVGRGVGPQVIRRFVEEEIFGRTDATAVVCDPPSANARSVRALEKAGFRRWRTVVPRNVGTGDLLLRRDRD
jgi:RimJ/RimL family protein N-acetyltransferase